MLKKNIIIIVIMMFAISCSVSRVSKLSPKKDLSLLTPGTKRALILSEFNVPIDSKVKDEKKVEVYAFDPGHSATAKFFRGLTYGAAAIYTLGISEAVTNPVEGALADKKKMVVEIIFDKNDNLESFVILKKK